MQLDVELRMSINVKLLGQIDSNVFGLLISQLDTQFTDLLREDLQ